MPKISIFDSRTARIRVKGSGGNEYEVIMLGRMPQACTCPSFEHRNGPAGTFCKHMTARHGQKAIGVTRCVRCPNWLTPEDLEWAQEQEIPKRSIPCEECRVVRQ